MTKILVFDTETTGLIEKGHKHNTHYNEFPHIVQLAWWFDGVLKDFIIRPDGYEIPEESIKIHGITTEKALKKGIPLDFVLNEFWEDASLSVRVVGHNIYFDTSIIKAGARKVCSEAFIEVLDQSLDKSKRICTMMKTIKFVGAMNGNRRKFPTLEELYFKLFQESFPAHDAAEDVKATLRCYNELVKLGVI